MDTAIVGYCRIGYFRVGVFKPIWDQLAIKFINATGASLDVTWKKLTLGEADSATGWYETEYTDSTIEMIILPRGSPYMHLAPGSYVREDAVGLTADVVVSGDLIETSDGVCYEVKGVRKQSVGTSFFYRECDLTLLPLQGLR